MATMVKQSSGKISTTPAATTKTNSHNQTNSQQLKLQQQQQNPNHHNGHEGHYGHNGQTIFGKNFNNASSNNQNLQN
jgi:hypothetical protein